MADFKGSPELRESNRKASAAYRARNLEARRLADREYARSIRERRLKTHKEWVSKNKGHCAAYQRKWRETAHIAHCKNGEKSSPKWANRFFINEIYVLARLRTEVTGIPWEVDHIIPFNGKTVCGLHVENNLRVVPRLINKTKGNNHAS